MNAILKRLPFEVLSAKCTSPLYLNIIRDGIPSVDTPVKFIVSVGLIPSGSVVIIGSVESAFLIASNQTVTVLPLRVTICGLALPGVALAVKVNVALPSFSLVAISLEVASLFFS